MNLLEIRTLLPELKELVVDLSEDLFARVNTNADINTGLSNAFKQIEKGGRTAQAYEVWLEDYLDQVAVAWVLACVFVRFMEDNALIDECWLAGEGDRRSKAEDAHTLYFRAHPHESDRDYFEHVFREVARIPAATDLFAEGKTPLWALSPSGDAVMRLLKFWREMNADSGHLLRSFRVEDDDTRFLGDLYQELSERAKKKYALLQTPIFVEEFILDRTLTPAIDEFGLEKVRMIDPTCGSGHFLLGAFKRLFRQWARKEGNEIKAAQLALDGVWGVDINPFAVAIARFRLIVAAVQACGIKTLKRAPGWNIHIASGDSLLFGCKLGFGGARVGVAEQFLLFDTPAIYAVEDRKALQEVLGQAYHVVVGNPPYITVKDRTQNEAYRKLYSTCHRKYSLAVPFAQRFWELAYQTGELLNGCGYIGQITANSFMKREFGKKLIEEFFPLVDLTHVIDTSGAYIPGHGTPTVILFGRSRRPTGNEVRAALGIKGEPGTPDDPAQGVVWRSIVSHIDTGNFENEFVSTANVSRSTFNVHPWSVGGGGVGDLVAEIEGSCDHRLEDVVSVVGIFGMTNADDVFLADWRSFLRRGVERHLIRQLLTGDEIRDWSVTVGNFSVFPYNESGTLYTLDATPFAYRWLWPARTALGNRATFGGGTYFSEHLPWWKWHQVALDRLKPPLTITFASVATHNHFVLDRGGKVFNRHAPIIKLKDLAGEDEHLGLLGILNCSLACFWMKQVFHNKGDSTDQHGARTTGDPAFNTFEFSVTALQQLPIPERGPVALARLLDSCGRQLVELLPDSAIMRESPPPAERSRDSVTDIHRRMISIQEELDWECYWHYGLTREPLTYHHDDLPRIGFGERAFEFILAASIISGNSNSDWYRRHNVAPISEMPSHWPADYCTVVRRRIELIQQNKMLALVERPEFKRRWHSESWEEQERRALRNWLLDRLESSSYRKEVSKVPTLSSTAQMTDIASGDTEFLYVASRFRGRADFDVGILVAELVESESVPFLPQQRYKASGCRKRSIWERTWQLQRQEDSGADIGEIPVPPKYVSADFIKADFWRLRGKLDIPKERWLSYPGCSTDGDPTLVVGWAGWNHLEQATALVAYYDARKREGWDAKRLTPLLAGLDQLLPWIHQWHPEVDPDFGETAGQSFQHMLENDLHELGLTLDDIRSWVPPEKPKTARRRKVQA